MADAAVEARDRNSRGAFGGFDAYRIPYDLDPMGGGGCEGRDLWPDSYGEEVLLLVSDAGSAYICPEKLKADWRIFIGPGGRAWKLLKWPANSKDASYESEDAREQAAGILSCALRKRPEAVSTVKAMMDGSFFQGNPALPLMLRGIEIALSKGSWRDWNLAADDGMIKVECNSKKFVVDDVPIAARWNQSCDVDPEWNVAACDSDRSVFAFDEKDMKEVSEILATRLLRANASERAVIDLALMAFERGWANVQEIERFEEACKEALSR
ncbi:MAG: hypothetical protein WC956_08235 [bacterium]